MDVDRVDNNAQSLPPHQIASDADFSFFVATTPGNVFFKCCFFLNLYYTQSDQFC